MPASRGCDPPGGHPKSCWRAGGGVGDLHGDAGRPAGHPGACRQGPGLGAVTADLSIVHLYPDLLRTYGDRGNVLCLQRRAEWRSFVVEVIGVETGDAMPPRRGPMVVVMGGGTDRMQGVAADDLAERRGQLEGAAARGGVVLGICGGFQLLGRSYRDSEGRELSGLGLLDVDTTAGPERMIGRVVARARL